MTAHRDWQGIRSPEPPSARYDYPDLLATAQAMLDTRSRRYPGMIARGEIDRDRAELEISTMAAIVADWRWITTGEGAPASADTLAARRELLDESLRTIRAIVGDRGGFDPQMEGQARHVIALRWHLTPERVRHTHWLAELTHELRRRAATSSPQPSSTTTGTERTGHAACSNRLRR